MKRPVFASLCTLLAIGLLPAFALAQNETVKKESKTTKTSRKAETTISESTLPDAVRKTFTSKFPNATINKAESEKEGGVTVWDIEFREGKKRKETDIAADGTMLEVSEQVTQKSLPKEALRSIKKVAEGGKVKQTDKVSISYEVKDGKIIKLDKTRTQYEASVTKGEQTEDVIVDESGKVIEEPKWDAAKSSTEKKSAA
jgi:hypothetical protein